jgi:hypothetical protein
MYCILSSWGEHNFFLSVPNKNKPSTNFFFSLSHIGDGYLRLYRSNFWTHRHGCQKLASNGIDAFQIDRVHALRIPTPLCNFLDRRATVVSAIVLLLLGQVLFVPAAATLNLALDTVARAGTVLAGTTRFLFDNVVQQ